jgi:hypothetical protein
METDLLTLPEVASDAAFPGFLALRRMVVITGFAVMHSEMPALATIMATAVEKIQGLRMWAM